MKKFAPLFTACLFFLLLAGCGKAMYHADFHGQEQFFHGAKSAYTAGETVELRYDMIATDTDYQFYVNADDVRIDWEEENHGYVIRFTMPEHDIDISCESFNTMVYDPDALQSNP